MTDKLDDLVEKYLHDVDSRLKGVTKSQRDELLLDLRAHIGQLRMDEGADSEAEIRNILDRLGDSETVAASARQEAGVTDEDTADGGSRVKQIVIWSLVALVALAAIIYFFFFSLTTSDSAVGATNSAVGATLATPLWTK